MGETFLIFWGSGKMWSVAKHQNLDILSFSHPKKRIEFNLKGSDRASSHWKFYERNSLRRFRNEWLREGGDWTRVLGCVWALRDNFNNATTGIMSLVPEIAIGNRWPRLSITSLGLTTALSPSTTFSTKPIITAVTVDPTLIKFSYQIMPSKHNVIQTKEIFQNLPNF